MHKQFWILPLIFLSACQGSQVSIIVPNNYTGTFKIVEGENADPYEARAKEEYGVYDYNVGDDELLVVDDLDLIKNASKLTFGYEWIELVTPSEIVYGEDEITVTIE